MNQIYCSNCGQLIPEVSNFCRFCGAAQHGPDASIYRVSQPVLGRAAIRAAEKSHKNPLKDEAKDEKPRYIKRRRLSPKVKLSFMVSYVQNTSILLVLLVLGLFVSPLLFGIALLFYALALYAVASLAYHHFYYSIDEQGFHMEYGSLHLERISVPYGKIQNINITRSPIDGMLGLYRICIETAGSASMEEETLVGGSRTKAEAHLPGVTLAQAKKIHDLVVRNISD